MSEFLHFTEHKLHTWALIVMACVYTLRLIWLLRFKAGKERQPQTGLRGTTPGKGILYSWANIAMPWAMESTRTKMFIYSQFVIFHIGVTASIGLSFIISHWPQVLANVPILVPILQVIFAASCLIGVMRLIRRFGDKHMRAISTPDDYFSLILLTVWFFFAIFAAPNNPAGNGEFFSFFFNCRRSE